MARQNQSLGSDSRVAAALRALGWDGRADSERWLRGYTQRRIGGWIEQAERNGIIVRTLDDVVRVVADRLRVKVIEIETDADLDRHVDDFCRRQEFAFAQLKE